jgi:hypothetical protein
MRKLYHSKKCPKIVDSVLIFAKVAPLCVTDQDSIGVCAEQFRTK